MSDANENLAYSSDDMKGQYHSYILRKILFIVICVSLVIVLGGYALTIGGRDIAHLDVYRIIWDHLNGATYARGTPEWWDDYIVWEVRLPRVLMAIIAGISLSVCGVAMQSMLKNPLADPYTTGMASGAVFGAVVAIVLGMSFTTVMGMYGIVGNAFIGGLIPALVIITISRFFKATPATIILAGIALSYMFNALKTLLLITTDVENIQTAYIWQIGSVQDAVWNDLPLMFAITIIGSIFLLLTSRQLNLLILGDDSAKSLGLDVSQFRTVCLILLSMMIASIVSFTGIIGFVGLVAPHMVRMILGADNRFITPGSMALGAALLLSADVVGRIIVSPGELPVGIIMSFIGGPIFLYLIIRQKKGYGEVY